MDHLACGDERRDRSSARIFHPQEFEDFRETIRKMVVERVAPRAQEIDEKAE